MTVWMNPAMPLWWRRPSEASSAGWTFPAPCTSEPVCFSLFDLPPAGEEVEHRIFIFGGWGERWISGMYSVLWV